MTSRSNARKVPMTPKKGKKKVMSAKEHNAAFRATMRQTDAILKRMNEREGKMAPMVRELRKFVNE